MFLRRAARPSIFVNTAPRVSSLRPARLFHTTQPKMVVKTINSKSEWDALLAEGKPVLVDFYATWCGPCKVISPMFEKHSDNPEYADVNFAKIDVDAVPEVAGDLGIRAMPTFMLFDKSGNKVDELLGANPPGLEKLVKQSV